MKIPKIGKEGKGEFVELPNIEPAPPETSPDEIDARRAKHVLERAVQLAEKGDYPGAILAARQAIALDRDFGDAHSVLGGLLERTGDVKGAISAHEKAVELMPQSTLERATLERLREKLGARGGGLFNFDDGDGTLFDPKSELPPVIDAKLPPTRAALEAKLPPTRAEIESSTANQSAPAISGTETSEPTKTAIAGEVTAPAEVVAAASTNVAASPHLAPTTEASVATPQVAPANRPVPEIKISIPEPAPVVATPSAAPTVVQRRNSTDRRQRNIPVSVERRSGRDRRADAATLAARAQSAGTPFVFNPLTDTPKPPLWAQTLRGPSFFARTLPLVAVTVFSLGFLSWARGRAIAQATAVSPTNPATASLQNPTDPPMDQAAPPQSVPAPGPNLAPAPPAQPGAPNGNAQSGFDINNRPFVAARPASPPASASVPQNASANPRPRTRTSTNANTSRPAPSFPDAQLAPAAIPPAAPQNGGNSNTDGGGNLGLPQPQINPPSNNAPVRVLPPGGNSANPPGVVGGGALNPAGNPGRGYVRIQSGRSVGSAPPRSQNQANNAEQDAAAAARGGQTDRAIQNLTTAIQTNPSDAGFRLQQRANLFLDRGDYGRAADDFQAAINAYQDQIARGEDANSARSGLRSARSGLNRALSARRGGG